MAKRYYNKNYNSSRNYSRSYNRSYNNSYKKSYNKGYKRNYRRRNYRDDTAVSAFVYLFFVIPVKAIIAFIEVIVIIICRILRLPSVRGKIGENKVKRCLRRIKSRDDYIIPNLVIINEMGFTSQIDHIFITKKGIFSIEVKNYSGKIFGKDSDRNWSQKTLKNKNIFYSPVKQNFTHMFELSKLLEDKYNINNVVIFVEGNISNVTSDFTFTLSGFARYFNELDECLTISEVKDVYDRLIDYKENHKVKNHEHIENIKAKQDMINSNICPRCGSELVEREGKYGSFMACPNYPDCTFSKKID